MINLKNKSILFISPIFFGYEISIKKRLENLGATVDYFDERPSNSFWMKGLIRANSLLVNHKIGKYYSGICSSIRNKKYDYFFVINIEAMPYSFLEKLKKMIPQANFILYMWDSVQNKRNTHKYLPYFDVVYSFDKEDCSLFSKMRFRPLFYLNEYKNNEEKDKLHYDISFIGTVHSDRFEIVKKVRQNTEQQLLHSYWYLYLQNWKMFVWNKILNPAFKQASFRDFSYKPLPANELLDVIKKSRIILDIQHPKQTGLTMRMIEMIGARKKIVTTNASVLKYDFYSPNNILVVDRKNPVITKEFILSEYVQLDTAIYERYSIDGWLNEIFSEINK